MQVDLDKTDGTRTYRSRLCIVGGGVAGLTLATEVASRGFDVHLLEAGGLGHEEQSQKLYEAEMIGHPHTGTTDGRFRVFGGSSTKWGGQLLPYTDDVLHPPSDLELPEWPIGLDEISPYYSKIQALLGVSARLFTAELLDSFKQTKPFESPDVRLRYSKWAPFSKRNLARTLGKVCSDSANVTVFLHAGVKALELSRNGKSIVSATVQIASGQTARFQADAFVICAGTIETSRLLLSSTSLIPAGVGNEHDQVGRYFHDHVGVKAAVLTSPTRQQVLRHFTPRLCGGTLHTPKLEASSKLRSEKHLLSVMAHFPIEETGDSALRSVQRSLRQIQSRTFDSTFYRNLLQLPGHSFQLSKMFMTARLQHKRPISGNAQVSLHIDCEQRPQPESRIKLSETTDRLGMQRAVVDWRISEDERQTIAAYASVIDDLFRAHGFGDIPWHPEIFKADGTWLRYASDTFHMMGGTRMGTNPNSSVVDANLRVHSVDNLHLASCSVFPTGGSSNPTFTMMALTLRLADQLKHTLKP